MKIRMWNAKYRQAAGDDGWVLDLNDPQPQIRRDMDGQFESDDAASAHVVRRAGGGDKVCQAALLEILWSAGALVDVNQVIAQMISHISESKTDTMEEQDGYLLALDELRLISDDIFNLHFGYERIKNE